MHRIWLALSIYLTIVFVGAAYLGWRFHTEGASWKDWHIEAGLFAAIFVCMVHSLVFVHLLGTGLGIKRAVDEHKLDESIKRELYRFKMRAFPPSMASMVATIVAAVLGGAALNGGSPTVHLVAVAIALAINLASFPVVVKQLALNHTLLRAVEQEVASRTAPAA